MVSLMLTPSSSDMDSLTGVIKILYDLFVPITFWPQKLLAMALPATQECHTFVHIFFILAI